MKSPVNGQQGVESVEVGGRLLEALAQARQPLMLRDLAAAAQMPPAKAHRYLVSYARLGLVEQQSDTGRYDIGPFAIRLGLSGLARLDPLRIAHEEITALRDRLQQTVAVAVWGNQGATIVRWLDVDAPVTASLRTGSVMPLTRSATGRVFLAFSPPAVIAGLLSTELASNRRHGLSPATRQDVQVLIEQARRHGLGRVSGDLVAGVNSVAAPVFDADGAITLAVTALGYGASFDVGWDGLNARAVRDCAAMITHRLGGKSGQS